MASKNRTSWVAKRERSQSWVVRKGAWIQKEPREGGKYDQNINYSKSSRNQWKYEIKIHFWEFSTTKSFSFQYHRVSSFLLCSPGDTVAVQGTGCQTLSPSACPLSLPLVRSHNLRFSLLLLPDWTTVLAEVAEGRWHLSRGESAAHTRYSKYFLPVIRGLGLLGWCVI